MRRKFWLILVAVMTQASFADEAPAGLSAVIEKYVEGKGASGMPQFRHAPADLNGDAFPDAVVMLLGSDWCGSGGCNLLVLRGSESGFELVSASTVTREPVRLSPERAHGWHTLIVYAKGVGDVVMSFDGSRYPSNPSLAPPASAEQAAAATTLLE